MRGIGTIEDDLKLCDIERRSQSEMYAKSKSTVTLLAVAVPVVALLGYFFGKK